MIQASDVDSESSPDSAWAQMILTAIRKRWPWIKHLFADSAYDRGQAYGQGRLS
jgi:hypothetical protein